MTLAFSKRTGILAGGVSLAAIAFVAFNIGTIQGPYRFERAPQPVANKPAKDDDSVSLVDAVGKTSADTSTVAASEKLNEAAPLEAEVRRPAAPQRMVLSRKREGAQSKARLQSGVVAGSTERDSRIMLPPADYAAQPGYRDQGRDKFADIVPNPVKLVTEAPVSTFSVDVDTASYAFVRSSLNNGVLRCGSRK